MPKTGKDKKETKTSRRKRRRLYKGGKTPRRGSRVSSHTSKNRKKAISVAKANMARLAGKKPVE